MSEVECRRSESVLNSEHVQVVRQKYMNHFSHACSWLEQDPETAATDT